MALFSHISFVNLYSNRSEELIAFYRDILGMTLAKPEEENDNHWFGFQAGEGLTFAIEPMSNRRAYEKIAYNKSNPILLQFTAKNRAEFDAMTAHLEMNHVPIIRKSEETSYGTITNFTDPDGNLLEILLPGTENDQ